MRNLNRSLVAATALGVGLAFATPGVAQVSEPTPAEQLARPDMTEDTQSAIRGYFQTNEPVVLDPGPEAQIAVGQPVPAGVEPFPLPDALAGDMPAGEFGYFATTESIVVIDMSDGTVAATVPRS